MSVGNRTSGASPTSQNATSGTWLSDWYRTLSRKAGRNPTAAGIAPLVSALAAPATTAMPNIAEPITRAMVRNNCEWA